jgi:hypothetical protein
MADIDQIIAGGAGASSRVDFSGLSNISKSYWQGRDEFAKNDLRDAFKGGVPLTPDGQPDFGAMSKVLMQKGALDQGIATSNLDLQRQNLKFGQDQSRSIRDFEGGAAPTQSTIVSPPSANRSASAVVAPPLNKGGEVPQGQPTLGQPRQPTVMTVLAQHVPNDQLGAASESVARQLGVKPTDPIDVNDPRISNVLRPAVAQIKRMGLGQVQQPVPQPQQPVQGQPSPVTNSVTTTQAPQAPSRVEQSIAYYAGIMSDPRSPKQNVDLAKTRLEALQKSNELTPLQKEYAQAVTQGFKGPIQDYETERESGKAAATERAKADVKEQQSYIEAGKAASQRLGTLNTLSNIISSDKNLTLGFGAETALKAKMALQQLGINVGDLSGAEAIQKLNASLASEMTKALASRPTQFEFKTFLANNPGLLLDKSGNVRLISLFSQLAKREYDLGKLARQNQENWKNWDQVVEKYDAEKGHQIIDPITKQVLSTNSIITPGPGKTTNNSGGATTTISSKADYDKLPSGAKFTGPDGKPWQKP